jgi:hypothetical protein
MSILARDISGVFAISIVASIGLTNPTNAAEGRNAALFGGFAAGALVGGALASGPRYAAPAPVYEAPPPPAVIDCAYERRPVYDAYGYFAGYRMIRVCD